LRALPGGLAFVAGSIYVFLYLPIATVLLFSFNDSRHGVAWRGFTTEWYGRLMDNAQAAEALKNSLILGVSSSLVSTALGALIGCALARRAFRGKRAVDALAQAPICIPDIVLAISLLLFFGLLRSHIGALQPGLFCMFLAHVTFQLPFAAMVVRARMEGIDPAIEEAAEDLGASRLQRLWHVTLPTMAPGLIGAGLLTFTLSLDDFVVSFFTSGPGSTTLPILIYSSVKRGITPEINALSSLLIAAAATTTILAALWRKKLEKTG